MKIEVTGPTTAPAIGEPIELAVVFRIERGWHIYWENPGDSGLATRVEASVPDGYTVAPLRFPRPRQFVTEYETTFGYEDSVALFLTITPPRAGSPEAAVQIVPPKEISIEIRWMVCKGMCFAGTTTRTVSIPSAAPSPELAAIVTRSRDGLPKPQRDAAIDVKVVSAAADGGGRSLRIEGALPARAATGGASSTASGAADEIAFLPKATPGVEYGAPALERRDGRFTLTIPLDVSPGNAMGEPLRAAGLLVFGRQDGPSFDIDSPVAAP